MNREMIQGKWNEVKGKVQKQWGKLTNDDLDQIKGDTNQLIGKVQQRYGFAKEQAQKEVDDFFNRM